MDAPFGSLDLTYQEEISKALPALTSQIITLLSQSQARGNVIGLQCFHSLTKLGLCHRRRRLCPARNHEHDNAFH